MLVTITLLVLYRQMLHWLVQVFLHALIPSQYALIIVDIIILLNNKEVD